MIGHVHGLCSGQTGRLGHRAVLSRSVMSEPSCGDRARWTSDGEALFADSFSITPASGEPHDMSFNACSKALGVELDNVDKTRMAGAPAVSG